ncbi:tetratricopeptide repeat protein [Loktanella agnita]|uniref:tetratricopeptide repeat protein n=1 Tax=Loktanella agnita TaxID=287097 RepID=UPI003985DEA1
MKILGGISVVLAVMAGLALYFHEDDATRAAHAYAQALGFTADGDVARASVAFRNVLKYDPMNLEARETYAQLMLQSGNVIEASGQYLRLLEQDPDNLDARILLSEMQIDAGAWAAARDQISRATEVAPDDLRVRALGRVVDYYDAIIADAPTARFAALTAAQALRSKVDSLHVLDDVILDGTIRVGDYAAALPLAEAVIKDRPDQLNPHLTRIGILDAMGRKDDVAASFQNLIRQFPENEALQGQMVQWYLANDVSGAERTLHDWAMAGDMGAAMVLVRLVAKLHGADAALEEISTLIAHVADPNVFHAMAAALHFDADRKDLAIDMMRDLIETTPDAAIRAGFQTTLAIMLDATSQRNAAEVVLAEVIQSNPNNTQANVLRAGWLLDRGQTDEAIILLRGAIDREPDNVQILRLLAQAHGMRAEPDLQARMLAMAVERADHGAQDALNYAAFLAADDRLAVAINVLEEARRRRPAHAGVLIALGELYVRTEAWVRAETVEVQLRAVDTPDAVAAANSLRTNRLIAQGQGEEALAALDAISAEIEDGPQAVIAVIRAQILVGDIAQAYAVAGQGVADFPENGPLQLGLAMLARMQGQPGEAVALYRSMLAENAQSQELWLNLIETLRAMDNPQAALVAAREGVAALPRALQLHWKVGILLENAGEIEAAISTYDGILAVNSAIPTVVNNLANLLATYRDDPESLDRAAVIAERLRDMPQPEFRETYGWVAFRKGDLDTALAYQVPAASELPRSALAQFRAGQILVAAGQAAQARAYYMAALDVVEPDQTALRQQATDALARLDQDTAVVQ